MSRFKYTRHSRMALYRSIFYSWRDSGTIANVNGRSCDKVQLEPLHVEGEYRMWFGRDSCIVTRRSACIVKMRLTARTVEDPRGPVEQRLPPPPRCITYRDLLRPSALSYQVLEPE